MAKIEFESVTQLLEWVKSRCSGNSHDAYVTEKNEIILAPNKSTKSLRYGYYKYLDDPEEQDKVIRVIKEKNILVFMVKNFVWDSERQA